MSRIKFELLSLCVVMFGLLIFAAGAQAEGTWLILNFKSEAKTATELPAAIELQNDSSVYILHSEILHVKVLLLCTSLSLVNAKLLAEGNIGKGPGEVKESKGLFSGCKMDLNGTAAPECTPKDPTDGTGFVVTKALHASATLHELVSGVRDDFLRVLPDEGETLLTLTLPATCPIGTSVPLIGKIVFKDFANAALTYFVEHLIEPFAALTELFTISKTAEHASTILGSASARLDGEHINQMWRISSL